MSKALETLYLQIGTELAAVVPEPYHSAWIVVERKQDVTDMKGFYLATEAADPVSLRLGLSIMLLFDRLHTYMVKEKQSDWQRAVFTLIPPTHFDLHYEYANESQE